MGKTDWRRPNPMPDESEITQTLSADIVIIGGGQAGTCAARAATENGASVIVIEKKSAERMRYNGGGQIAQINSEFARHRGAPEIDPVEFLNDWQIRANNRANPALIMKFIKRSGACMDWILSRLSPDDLAKVEIQHIYPDGTVINPKTDLSGIKTWVGCVCLMTENQEKAMSALRRESEENGANWIYGAVGWNLIKETGGVKGAIAKTKDGNYIRCLASKGVLLACGDFGGDEEMVRDLCTEPADLMPEAHMKSMSSCDGTGHKLGVWAGGRMEPRPVSTMGGNYAYPGGTPGDPIGTTAALWLNTHGKRYCNEGFGDIVLSGIQGLRQPAGKLSVLFDSDILNQVKKQAPGHLSFDYTSRHWLDKLRQEMDEARCTPCKDAGMPPVLPEGAAEQQPVPAGDDTPPPGGPDGGPPGGPTNIRLLCADTLEELAEKLGYTGCDKENFLQAVARYNELCHLGKDLDFGKSPELLFPVEQAPYYGYQSEKSLGIFMCTTGGLLTDENQNVLGEDFEPIPGLYATGNVCGGRFGLQYTTPISGISIGMAQTLGREAGRYLADLP